jgi:hypothetical protein
MKNNERRAERGREQACDDDDQQQETVIDKNRQSLVGSGVTRGDDQQQLKATENNP